MKMIIDISEKDYRNFVLQNDNGILEETIPSHRAKIAIANGQILPKGHGRLIDADALAKQIEVYKKNWDANHNEYESGRVVNIKRTTLKKISDVLGLRPIELISEVSPEVQKKNDILSDIILTLREDNDLLDIVESLMKLDADKRTAIKSLISAFSATDK